MGVNTYGAPGTWSWMVKICRSPARGPAMCAATASARSSARAMALVLLSGRPGAGKTGFASWLAGRRGFVYVETDAEWGIWGPLVCVQSLEAAFVTRNLARALGPNVVIEWGFKVASLGCSTYFGPRGSMPGGSTAMRQQPARDTSAEEVPPRV
jgi:hypothetical protein